MLIFYLINLYRCFIQTLGEMCTSMYSYLNNLLILKVGITFHKIGKGITSTLYKAWKQEQL